MPLSPVVPTLDLDEPTWSAVLDALDAPVVRAYAPQVPFHYGVVIPYEDGGPDPLEGVSIYWNPRGPHWHYVSSGFFRFGVGFELTFRLAARPDEIGTEPATHTGSIAYNAPTHPIMVMNMLARRVLRTQRAFGHGHWWEGPPGSLPAFLLFATDPELGTVQTPIGPVGYLQATAATAASIAASQADESAGRGAAELDRLLAADPLLVSPRDAME